MEPVLIVDLLNECCDAGHGVIEVAITSAIDFFNFQCFDKTLGPCVVIGIAGSAHADGDTAGFESLDVFAAGVLNTAVGMMHQTWCRTALVQSHFQCLLCQCAVELSAEAPAHDPPRVDIQNYSQVDEFLL